MQQYFELFPNAINLIIVIDNRSLFFLVFEFDPPHKNIVKIHEDWLAEGKDWCKKNLDLHEWAVEGNVEPYYCHFSFEHKQDANNFLIFSKFFK